MSQYNLPRGTRDFLPQDAEKAAYVEHMLKAVSQLYGYREIRTPIFEHTDLFLRSVGESSDIVNKEMYTFIDKGNRSITLRPEGTAGVIRAFVENRMFSDPDLPIKLFYNGPTFRYEKPQAGRFRQINQFGFECIGIHSPLIDTELILMITSSLFMLGLKDFKIKINSIGDLESRKAYKEALKNYFKPHLETMCPDCNRRFEQNPLRILDCKIDGATKLVKNAPTINDYLNVESKEYFAKIIEKLSKYQVPFEIDYRLVRGLDYYTDTVFEIIALTAKGEDYGSIGAGGRYDGLVEEIGGPAMPGVGMAFGVDRLCLLLESHNLFSGLENKLDAYLMPLDKQCLEYGLELLMYLRSNGFKTEMDYACRSIKSQFKTIERQDIPFAVLLGENELKTSSVTIKNTKTKDQVTIPANQLVPYLDKAIEALHSEKCGCGCEDEEAHACHCGHNHNEDNCNCEHGCDCEHDEEDKDHNCECDCNHKK